MECPKCESNLTRVSASLGKTYTNGNNTGKKIRLEVDQCFECNGVWFDHTELETYLLENLTVINSPEITPGLKKNHNEKIGNCPKCNTEMLKEPAPKDETVTLDKCSQCQGVWLDMTEIDCLEQVEQKSIDSFFNLINRIF